jgi:hypothetical protein
MVERLQKGCASDGIGPIPETLSAARRASR